MARSRPLLLLLVSGIGGSGPVRVEARGVRAERHGEGRDGAVVVHEAVEQRPLLPRLLHRVAHHHQRARQDVQEFRVAPGRVGAPLHVGVVVLRVGEGAAGREHHLGGLGGDLPAGVGSARLHDHRPALHRPRDVERAADLQELAFVVEHMHALRVEEYAARRVAEEGVVRPTVPKAGHHVEELAGAAVARGVLPVLVAAEIPRLHRIAGGDEVPAGAAAADVVQRGEFPRDVVGLVVGGRGGGDQPEPLRHHRQRRQ